MDKMFKLSAIAVALMAGTAATSATASESAFLDDSTITGGVYYWQRDRDREQDASKDGLEDQLDHITLNANLDFNSGYISDTVGFDAAVFGAYDLNTGTNGVYGEMNFFPDGSTPYDTDWSATDAVNGVSLYKAALKAKFGDAVTAKAGYFQPSVPSTVGVNWGFMPGTYLGGEAGFDLGIAQIGAVFASEYKAPWFKDTYEFQDGAGNDAGSIVSVGLRTSTDDYSFDFGYGSLTDGDRTNMHAKVGTTTESGVSVKGQVYVVDDPNQFESNAFQAALLTGYSTGAYSLRGEITHTEAEHLASRNNVGNFSYRLTEAYGGSNGAYDIWWNNRSDFNHDGETAIFAAVNRDLTDLGYEGLSAGLSTAYGFGSENDAGKEMWEFAYSVMFGYNAGFANFGFHYTVIDSNVDNAYAEGFSNHIGDEQDLKVTMVIPFSLK